MSELRAFAGQVSRFVVAGLANTAVGLSVTAVLDIGFHVNPALANAAGYAVGLICAFVLSKRFVFRSKATAAATGPKFLAVALFAFALNQMVLQIAGRILGDGAGPHLLAQLIAMSTYTATNFVLCRLWVFRRAAP